MHADALRAHYRNYIQCLNDRRLDDLGDYVGNAVVYNGAPYTLDDYRRMLVGDTTAIPDLVFSIGLLVVEDDHVAARLDFDCTPQADFLGFRPNGRRIAFSENVFYAFTDGKITEVWSLIDRDAIERQLGTAHRLERFSTPA